MGGAALLGALLSLTLPPFDLLPMLIAYAGLVMLLEVGEAHARRPLLERALLGGAFGFGYHLAGLWWVGAAFLVDAETFGALLPFAVVGLPLLLAPFNAIATAALGLVPSGRAWRVVGLAVALTATEWLRGVVLTGFPWNAAGVGLASSLMLAQGAALVGLHGLAFPAVLLGAAPAAVRRGSWPVPVAAALLLAAIAGYGSLRLEGATTAPPPAADRPRVRIVQPSIPQGEKWEETLRARNWQRLLDLTAQQGAGAVDIVIWPETALPFVYRAPSLEQMQLVEALAGRTLVTGAVEIEMTTTGRVASNSMLVVGADGAVAARYDKAHLVPFGEYVPFGALLTRFGMSAMVQAVANFRPGAPRPHMNVPGLGAIVPVICYEAIFRYPLDGAADLALNVTNDGWFGDTPGPRQHLRVARMRALEVGLPLVRAANNGISAAVDPYGAIIDSLPLDHVGVIDIVVPEPVPTLYRQWGDWPALGCGLLFLVACLVRRGTKHTVAA